MAKVNEVAASLSEPCHLLGSRTPLQLVAISNVKLNNEIFSNRSLSIHKRILVKNFLTLLYQLNPIEWIEESPVDEQDGWMEQTLSAAGLGDANSSDPYNSTSTHTGPMRNETARDSRSPNKVSQSSTPRPASAELPQSLHSYLAAVFDVNWSVDLPSHEDSWSTPSSSPAAAFASSSSGLNDQSLPRSLLSASSTDAQPDSGLKHVVPLARKSSLQYSSHSSQHQHQQQQQQQQQQQSQQGTPTQQPQQNRTAQARTKPTLVPGRRSSLMHAGSYTPAVPQKSPEAKAVDTASSHSNTQLLTVTTNPTHGGSSSTTSPTSPSKSPTGPTPVYTRRSSSLVGERTKVSPRMPSNDRTVEPTTDHISPASGLPRPLNASTTPTASTALNSTGSKTSLGAKTRRQVSAELDLKPGQQQPPSSSPQQHQTFTRGVPASNPHAPRQFTISSPPSSPSLEEDSSPIFSPTPTFLSASKKTSPALPSPSPSPPLLLPGNPNDSLQTPNEEASNSTHPTRPYAYSRSTSDDDIFQARPARLAEPQKTYLPSSKSSPSLATDSGLASEERALPPLPSHVQSSIRPSLVEYHQYHELQKQFLTEDRQAQQEAQGSLVSNLGLGKLLTRSNSKNISISAPFLLPEKDSGKPQVGPLLSSSPPSVSGTLGITTGKTRGRNAVSMLKGTLSSVKSGLVRSSSQILPSATTTVAAAAAVMNSTTTTHTNALLPPSNSRYGSHPPQILGGPSSGTVSSLSTASYSSTSSNSSSSSSSSSSASPTLGPSATMTTTTAYNSAPVPLQHSHQQHQQPTLSGRSARDAEKTYSMYSAMTTSSVYSGFPQPPAPTHYSPHGGTHTYAGMTSTPATVSLATGGHETSPSSSSSNSPRWNSMKSMFGLRVASQEAS
ncbi:hypothetical protein DFQ27_008891 [Actinomortierella ambigua]|uniref:Uncharacterized protein n=1 Tax=Actinomortierella ambigua TaxID=1343610 RepID=A0A9P6PSR3_9FUNG|nr:hypothetical protein DFQ27_008891 [Actinomortierella ambigua]